MRLRPLDFVAVVVAILAVVGVSVFAYGSDADPTRATAESSSIRSVDSD